MGRHDEAVENAWKIHDAQLDWTAKADAKAAFAFGIDSAAIAAVVVLISTDRVLHHFLTFWPGILFIFGMIGLVGSSVASAIGVAPRLKRKDALARSATNHIYFGHARLWNPKDLEASLLEEDLLPQLTRNIVVSADISWKKHVAVTWSLWLTMAAGVLLVAFVIFEPH
jgi:hypothetical protein